MSQFKGLECRTDLGEEFKQELLAKFDRIHRLIKGEGNEEIGHLLSQHYMDNRLVRGSQVKGITAMDTPHSKGSRSR